MADALRSSPNGRSLVCSELANRNSATLASLPYLVTTNFRRGQCLATNTLMDPVSLSPSLTCSPNLIRSRGCFRLLSRNTTGLCAHSLDLHSVPNSDIGPVIPAAR